MYYLGEGTKTDYSEAARWFRKSAEQGNADAHAYLGVMYEEGQGVPQNVAEAMKWYASAARLGNPGAQLKILGASRDSGNGTPPMPAAEKQLIAAVDKGRTTYVEGANDMAKGAARPARAKEICTFLKDVQVRNWRGRVKILSSNSDGFGVLSVQIGDNISIKTWNNSISDVEDKTLIVPDSTIFRQAIALKQGQQVTFAGQFFLDPTDCIREGSLTLEGSLTEPEFIFRFSEIAVVE
jgi:hypothetical protein